MSTKQRVIPVCGKGGVGKTAFTTLLTKVITRDKSAGKLLVVDADPALGLHYALGRDEIKTIGTVRDEILRVPKMGIAKLKRSLPIESIILRPKFLTKVLTSLS